MITKKIFLAAGFFVLLGLFSFDEKKKEKMAVITTTFGDIKIKLYDETPKHRDNFIKLVNEHLYDSTLFHRVIQSFMIQGGDPDSKKAIPGAMLGNGNVGYTIPAEFNPKLFHKRGALAAARLGDDINPHKESSGCQFYIVQGRVFSNNDLNTYEIKMNQAAKQQLFSEFINRDENSSLKKQFFSFQQSNQIDSLKTLSTKIEPIIEKEFASSPHFQFSDEQRKAYSTMGGAPHLDGNYTVFGEVIEGLDVVDKIASVQVDGTARPLSDIRMNIKMVN